MPMSEQVLRIERLPEQPEALWIALERYLIDAIFGPAGGAS